MPSIRSRLVMSGLSVYTRLQSRFPHEDFEDRRRAASHRPTLLTGGVAVERGSFEGWPVYLVTPRSGGATGHILYIHGGAYVAEILPSHWRFVAKLAELTNRTVTVPIYPLAPGHTHNDVIPVMARLYGLLAEQHPPETLAVMGDSAGGGLGTAVLQSLPRQTPRPRDLVLLSPWLDASMTSPAVVLIERSDPVLTVESLRRSGRQYAGKDEPSHPQASPINGPLDRLGRVTVFTGTRDVLHPDAGEFQRRAAGQHGTEVTVHEYDGMFHGWMITPVPFPEAAHALEQIAALLTPPNAASPAGSNTFSRRFTMKIRGPGQSGVTW
jgi:acetyl esterase/lipase